MEVELNKSNPSFRFLHELMKEVFLLILSNNLSFHFNKELIKLKYFLKSMNYNIRLKRENNNLRTIKDILFT
jgi:hypothetical protein